MTDRELLELVEEGMKVNTPDSPEYIVCAALRARLAQPEPDDGYCQACEGNHCTAKNGCVALDNPRAQPEPEPVAYDINGATVYIKPPVYTAPPQREWQGLTDEEIENCFEMSMFGTCRAIEAKLKEKNSG